MRSKIKIMEEIKSDAQKLSFTGETYVPAITLEELDTLLDKYIKGEDTASMPYIRGRYNRNYGDNKICACGHVYERHFDSYYNMSPCGCKYCSCSRFVLNKTTRQLKGTTTV